MAKGIPERPDRIASPTPSLLGRLSAWWQTIKSEPEASSAIFVVATMGGVEGFLAPIGDLAGALHDSWGATPLVWKALLWAAFVAIVLVVAVGIRVIRIQRLRERLVAALVAELSKAEQIDDLEPVTTELAALFRTLLHQSHLPVRGEWARRLAILSVRTYIERIQRITKGRDSQVRVFPCTFEVYASAVVKVLDDVKECSQEDTPIGRHREIWTRWSGNLLRWYNLTIEAQAIEGADEADRAVPANGVDWMHSHTWWEEYKAKVTGLKASGLDGGAVRSVDGPRQACRIHRLVHDWNPSKQDDRLVERGHRAVVYIPPDQGGERLSYRFLPNWPEHLKAAMESGKGYVTLLPQIARAIAAWTSSTQPNVKLQELPLTLLGIVEESKWEEARSKDAIGQWPRCGCWIDCREHFEREYHDREAATATELADKAGTYCNFTDDAIPPTEYDDVFIVDGRAFSGNSDDIFGLAFYDDRIQRLSGMVFLDKGMAEEVLQRMQEKWAAIPKKSSGGGKR